MFICLLNQKAAVFQHSRSLIHAEPYYHEHTFWHNLLYAF